MSSPDVLFLAAFHPELAPLVSVLGESLRGRVANVEVTARVVGIGLPMAAVGAATHLVERKPALVVLIGTCGAYRHAGFSIGEVIVARRLRLVDLAALRALSQFPEPMSIATEAHPAVIEDIARSTKARPADVATTLAITIDDATAALIANHAASQVEHLEAYAVATACAARGVPFAAVLGVANHVGASARDEWRVHHRAGARAAAEVALQWIEGGGPLRVRSTAK